jgi:hypothetical protein
MANAQVLKALNGTGPQPYFSVNGIFYKHGNVYTAQGFCNFLHIEWIYGRTRTYPQNIYTCFQSNLYVLGICDLSSNGSVDRTTGIYQPLHGLCANTFKTPGFGPGFPNATAQQTYGGMGF